MIIFIYIYIYYIQHVSIDLTLVKMHIYVITIINIRRHSRVMLYRKIGRTNNRTSTMIISLRSMFFFFVI